MMQGEIIKEEITEDKVIEETMVPEYDTEEVRRNGYENVVLVLSEIIEMFKDKIKTDEHKNKMFDNMHEELVRYRNGAIERGMDSAYLDIIQLADTYRNIHAQFAAKETYEPQDIRDMLDNLENISYDLDDVLYRMGVEPFVTQGSKVDPKRQKISRILPTNDPACENMIAEKISRGYEKNGRVIKPEKIAIYKIPKSKGEKL